jgi:hypothetical protein
MMRAPSHVPIGFTYGGRLDGGGYAFEGQLRVRSHVGPLRRLRIRRARRAGDLRKVAALLLLNAGSFDIAHWDAQLLSRLVPVLVEHAGLKEEA